MCTHLSSDLSGLRLLPQPRQALASGALRLRVHAAALNFPDLLMAQGKYQHRPPLPFVAGMECAGEVLECAAGVPAFKAGDKLCYSGHSGAFAEELVAPAAMFRPVPGGLAYDQGAAYAVTALTAWVALVRRAALQPGETLLVHGASGGTGLAAVQLGRFLGATVIATGGSAQKLEAARTAGAHHLLIADKGAAGLSEAVKGLTGGAGADVVFDPVGGDLFDASVHCTAWGGRLLVVGFAGGRIASVPSNLPLIKGFAVIGVRAGEYGRRDPERGEQNRRAVDALAARGVFIPRIGARLPFEQAPEAYRAMAERRSTGKIVLQM